jgi:hypothetical protein
MNYSIKPACTTSLIAGFALMALITGCSSAPPVDNPLAGRSSVSAADAMKIQAQAVAKAQGNSIINNPNIPAAARAAMTANAQSAAAK